MHEGRYQAQKGLMLRVQRPRREKGADVEVRYLTSRWRIRFMSDEYSPGLVPAQKPLVSVRAAIKISSLDLH